MKWFRFYTEIIDDVKMLQLTDYEYRMFTYLLCHASEVDSKYGECRCDVTSLSVRCRTRVSHLKHAIETFQKLGLVSINGDGIIKITNWSKRQFKSDDAYARVKKYREVKEKRNVSNPVSETLPDTDTDKQIQKKKINRSKIIFQTPSLEEVKDYCVKRGNSIDAEAFIAHYNSNGWMVGKNKMKNWQATIVTWEKRNYGTNENRVRGNTRSLHDKEVDEEAERINREWREAQNATRLHTEDDAG